MTAPQRSESRLYTEEEYFRLCETSEERWEFLSVGSPGMGGSRLGHVRLMAGGSDDHATISGNVFAALHSALTPKGCRTYTSDMRVHTGSDKNFFPDVAVVCGPRDYYQGRTDTLTNPILIVEVLSPSTTTFDLGEKYDHYKTISALRDYMILFQDQARALHCSRREGGEWDVRFVVGRESAVDLPSVNVTLALADVYRQIEFGTEED